MKLLSKLFWRKRSTQAAAIAPLTIAPPAPMQTQVTPTPMTTTLPTTPKTSTSSPAVAPKFDPLKDSKLFTRAQFDALGSKERNEFIRNGGKLVADVRFGDMKDIAAETIKTMNSSPEEIAETLVVGFDLGVAVSAPILTEWAEIHRDPSFSAYKPERLKAALATAEKSSKPKGYLATQVNDESRIARRRSTPFAKPGEVPESERVAAEDALVKLLTEFEAISNRELKRIWWEKNSGEVEDNAKKETKRSTKWIGYFVEQLPMLNAHITPGDRS